MKVINETSEFVYSVNPNGALESVTICGVRLDWNDGDLVQLTDAYLNKKGLENTRPKRTMKQRRYFGSLI